MRTFSNDAVPVVTKASEELRMPVDQESANTLTQALQQVRAACQRIESILPGNAAVANAAPDQRIEILQKNFAEVSNYDRHYSTTRSALTTLLITVGLLLAKDPLSAIAGRTSCTLARPLDGVIDIFYQFPITLLLFLLSIPLNLHFRRLTASCAALERSIEREIGHLAAIPGANQVEVPHGLRNLAAPPIGYHFRLDLRRAYRAVGWPRVDTMTLLLVPAILEFIAICYCFEVIVCKFWSLYWNFLILLAPLLFLLVFYLARLLFKGPATAEDVAG